VIWIGLAVGTVCAGLKLWIIYHDSSHPCYRGHLPRA
jgi:hypothetical protein